MALCDMNETSISAHHNRVRAKSENRLVAFIFCAAKMRRSTNH